MAKIITILLSLLALTVNVQSQFYDFFQNYQPFLQIHQTTKRPDSIFYAQEEHKTKTRGETAVSSERDRHTSKEQVRNNSQERDSNRRTTKKKHTTTVSSLFNLNFFTTPKPKKTKNTNRRNFDTNVSPQSNENRQTDQQKNSALLYGNNKYYDENLNNIAGDYYTTTKHYTTPKPYTTTRQSYTTKRSTTKRNTTPKPIHTTRPSHTTRPKTTRPYASPANFYNDRPDANTYTTYRPGVKPANVDLSKPPITNRPTKLAVYPKPTDSSVIRFPEDPDVSPDVITGPDEDRMSYVEKRRYIEIAEKMCDKYKSLNVKRLEAIPLVPSPEPVRVNVSVCPRSTVPLVVGGKVVTIQEFPHMALLGWTKLQGGGYSWKCGGSLISDQYVLTASHCAYQDKDDTVVTGAPRVVQLGSSYLDDAGALVLRVLAVARHPKYVQNRSYYDIALVKMVKPVSFSEVVKPACLGQPPGVGEPVIATGWGRTEFGGSQSLELRSVSIPVWDIEDCHRVLGTSRKLPNGPSADSQICAGEKNGGKDTCQGDSGGPAQIQDGCAWRIVAVTSVGRSCGAPNTPALYATLHIPFIAAQIYGKNIQTDKTPVPITSVNNDNSYNPVANVNNDSSNNYNRRNNSYNSYNGNNNNRNQNNNRDVTVSDSSSIYYNNQNNNNYNNPNNNNYNNHNNNNYNSGDNNQGINRETYNNNNNYNTQELYSNRPNTNLDNQQDAYSFSPQNYNNYNNDRNSNYDHNYYVQPSYTVTEAPRFNNQRSWWQPY